MTIFHKSIGKEYKILENGLKNSQLLLFPITLLEIKEKRGTMGKKGQK
jgi:hypothetical protein